MEDKIKEILEKISPYINSHGGTIDFIKYDEGFVYIKLLGACSTCEWEETTLNDILQSLQEEIPAIEGVIPVDF